MVPTPVQYLRLRSVHHNLVVSAGSRTAFASGVRSAVVDMEGYGERL